MANCAFCPADGTPSRDLIFHAHSPTTFRSSCRFTWASHPNSERLSAILHAFIAEHDVRDGQKRTMDRLEEAGAWERLWAVLEEEAVLDSGKWKTTMSRIRRGEVVEMIRVKIRGKVARMVMSGDGGGKKGETGRRGGEEGLRKMRQEGEGEGEGDSAGLATVGPVLGRGCTALIPMPVSPSPPVSASRELVLRPGLPALQVPSLASFFGPFQGLGAVPLRRSEMDLQRPGPDQAEEERREEEEERGEEEEKEQEQEQEQERHTKPKPPQEQKKRPQRLLEPRQSQPLKPRGSPGLMAAAAAATPVPNSTRLPVKQPSPSIARALHRKDIDALADALAKKKALEDELERVRLDRKGRATIRKPVTPALQGQQKTEALLPAPCLSPSLFPTSSLSPSLSPTLSPSLSPSLSPTSSPTPSPPYDEQQPAPSLLPSPSLLPYLHAPLPSIASLQRVEVGAESGVGVGVGVGVEVAPAGSKAEMHGAINADEEEAQEEEAQENIREAQEEEAQEEEAQKEEAQQDIKEAQKDPKEVQQNTNEVFQLRTDFTPLSALRAANREIDAKMDILRTLAGWTQR
ncbi:hypothetical protein MBM_09699 [Drepanopeziza brunnea f. sp. 'multigermtubi' MB_m1]|uniref:Uncharacterized protein n=1 Tax=Marssonina brunnea f. sp. multigermtubi (strain MB_m1) TaxID=1072389 RepID=K1XI61_MARBU|nr:uncharacterized protein MBM_09699 [Drepanopeziza brunnea f. sp. 'multigermtubi' MB_m1]EKD12119.1 hypothetical protein MBM_09699 [Drepanopeziza brunnea f. sp. 'multigermtubi' MB_m1]